MKIKPATSKKKRAGYRYDSKKNIYVTYKIDGQIDGKRFRQGGFLTRKSAEDFIDAARLRKKYKRAGIKHVTESPRLSELLEKRLSKINTHAERVRGERIFSIFQSLFIGDPRVTEVSSGDFQLFINARDVKPETINRELNLLSKAFSDGSALFPKELEGYEPPKVPRPKFKRKRREKIVTEKEKDAIVKILNTGNSNSVRIGRMFELAWYLGMAYKEVATLKKSNYNGSLEFIRHKTGAPIKFEWLPDEVHAILKSAIADSETEYVFTISGSTPKHFYKIMQSAIEGAGLVYGRDKGITFHTARHSFVTSAMQVADLKTVGSMSGHSDEVMVLLYTHASPESRKRALQSMYSKVNLSDIFDRVKSGEMSFEEFEKLVR